MRVAHGIYPWGNTLVRRSLDGESFLGRLWMVFLGGVGEGKGTRQGKYYRVVFAGDVRVQRAPFFMLCITYWSVGVSLQHVSDHRERPPILDTLVSMSCSSWDSSTTLFHTLKTVKVLLHLVPSRTPRRSGYGVLCTCVFVTCYFCYMFSLG